jgi:hypothetical protein
VKRCAVRSPLGKKAVDRGEELSRSLAGDLIPCGVHPHTRVIGERGEVFYWHTKNIT